MNKFKKILISALACCSVGLAAMASVATANNKPVQANAEETIFDTITIWSGNKEFDPLDNRFEINYELYDWSDLEVGDKLIVEFVATDDVYSSLTILDGSEISEIYVEGLARTDTSVEVVLYSDDVTNIKERDGIVLYTGYINLTAVKLAVPHEPASTEAISTFDFTTNLYGHEGVSSGSGSEYVDDGDIAAGEKFTEEPTQIEFILNGSSQTKFWDASSKHELRLYKGATFVLSVVGNYKITKVEFTGSAVNLEANGTTVSNKVWEGNATKSITFVNTSTTSKINNIKVTYITVDPAAENPTITTSTMAAVYWEPITVTMGCATEGATIHYTLDGSDPTIESAVYSEPILISAKTTVKAIAVKEGLDNSEVVSQTFDVATIFASLEELVENQPATDDTTHVQVTITDAVIEDFYENSSGYINGIYVTAASTTVEIHCNDVPSTWKVGGKVSGTIKAEWKLYKGVPELIHWEGDWDAFTYRTTPIEIVIDELALAQDFGTFYAFELIDNETNFSFRFVIYYSGSFEFGKTYTFDDMDQINSDLYLVGEIGRYAKYSACDFVATLDNDVIKSIEANVTLTTGIVYHLTYPAPVSWPEDAPTEAPTAPTYDGVSLLGAPLTTNLDFQPLDWPGSMPEKLTFETGETIYYMEKMNWQIYTNWAEDSYDMSEYDTLHVDLFPAADTWIRVQIEGLSSDDGGQGYRNSVEKTLTAGEWNCLDIALSEFPKFSSGEAYDFSDFKYFTLEGNYDNQIALSVGNVYFYKAPHEHAIKTTHAKVEAKCEEAGHEAYYECSCGKYFSDEDLTNEITDLQTWLAKNGDGYIAPIGHNIGKVNGTPATEGADGFKDAYKCNNCGQYFEDAEGTKLIGDEAAYNAWKLAGGKIEKLDHDMVLVSGAPATEGADGFKDAYKCNNCGQYFEDAEGTKLIGDEAAYNAWKLAEGKIPALDPQKENGLSGGAIAGIVIGSVFGLLIIAFVVLYILWKRKNLNVPILSKVLTPAFRFINKLFFKTKLNDVEAKEAENKAMKE